MIKDNLGSYFEKVFNEEILEKFKLKNDAYANQVDPFKAFRTTAERWFPEEYKKNPYNAMSKVMGILQDKHLAALPKGFDVLEYRDRLIDIIVYSLFGLAFFDAGEEEAKVKAVQVVEPKEEKQTYLVEPDSPTWGIDANMNLQGK